MNNKNYKYVYGPVASWRLGSSLGVDPISAKEKICTFNCIYCQLGKTKIFEDKRKIYVPVKDIIREISSLPNVPIDYITFSGAGEPTLAKNLGKMIKAVKKTRKEKIAVITNSSLLNRKDVQKDLALSDFIIAKLDGFNSETFNKINQPMPSVKLTEVTNGIKIFGSKFNGKLALQIMFTKYNKNYAKNMALLAAKIKPDEIQINTPLRPCAVTYLKKTELTKIKQIFLRECTAIKVFTVYDVEKIKSKPISSKATLKRRGKV